VTILDQAGAQTVLQSARESAQRRNAPSAIAGFMRPEIFLLFQRMDGCPPGQRGPRHPEARTAARLQRPTVEIEDSINQGRAAFVTAKIMALRGGMSRSVSLLCRRHAEDCLRMADQTDSPVIW
jgi:glc operon protein GlcG